MGLDLKLQAVPEDWDGLDRAGNEADFGELLSLLPSCAESIARGTDWRPWPLHDDEREFLDSARVLVEGDPAIWKRVLRIHRRWDALHFLLSRNRRDGPRLEKDFGSIAIRGAENLGEKAKGGQGAPICWTNPDDAQEVNHFLHATPTAEFVANYDWDKMHETATYNQPAREHEAAHRETLAAYIDELRGFYADAAVMQYGVLHMID